MVALECVFHYFQLSSTDAILADSLLQLEEVIARNLTKQTDRVEAVLDEFYVLENRLEEEGQNQFLTSLNLACQTSVEFLETTFQGTVFRGELPGKNELDGSIAAVQTLIRKIWHQNCQIIRDAPLGCRPSRQFAVQSEESFIDYKNLRLAVNELQSVVRTFSRTGSDTRDQDSLN